MRLTRTHALYWAQRRSPKDLRVHVQKVSIDHVVNAHAGLKAAASEPNNTITLLSRRSNAERIDLMQIYAGMTRIDQRVAYCRRWLKKILKNRKSH